LFCFVGVTDDDVTDKIVSVHVDDEESMIQFIDIPGSEVSRYPCRLRALQPSTAVACRRRQSTAIERVRTRGGLKNLALTVSV